MELRKASIRLLLALNREHQRVKPLGHCARIVTNGKEPHYLELQSLGFVSATPYPLAHKGAGVAYQITEAGERHCRFALNSGKIMKKESVVYENHP